MKIAKITSITISTLCLFIGLGLWFFIPSYFFVVNSCRFAFDTYFAEHIKQTIIRFGQEKFTKKPFQKISLETIKAEFPFVAQVNAKYHYDGKINCFAKAYRPLLNINGKLLMVENGQLYDVACFSPELIQHIPFITVNDVNSIRNSTFFKEYIQNFPRMFFELFSITWIDHTLVEMHDKKSTNFVLVAQYKTNFDKKLLYYYEQIKQQIMSQRSYIKKRWRIDIRFKNQIIVTQRDVGDS